MRKLILLAFATAACTLEPPFERNNPYDPINSPGLLRSVLDTAQLVGQRSEVSLALFGMPHTVVALRTPGVLHTAAMPSDRGTRVFTAVGVGSTWVVVRAADMLESVFVTVRP
jgi:hypothetical protein